MDWGYNTLGIGASGMAGAGAGAGAAGAVGGAGGIGSLMSMFGKAKQNGPNVGGFVGDAVNVGMGFATGNPIQVAMGLMGGVNDIMSASQKRKEARMAGLQKIQGTMGKGW